MDGTNNGLKLWKCKNNHVLGIVQRVQIGSDGDNYWTTRLALFRQAIDADEAVDIDVIANIEGTVTDIRCSVCGEVRTWWLGEAGLERLLKGMGLEIKSDKSPG